MKPSITRLLPETTQLEFGYTCSKLTTHFQRKGRTIPESNFSDNYVAKSGPRISEREQSITMAETKTRTFSSIVASKFTQTPVVDLRTFLVEEKLQKHFRKKI